MRIPKLNTEPDPQTSYRKMLWSVKVCNGGLQYMGRANRQGELATSLVIQVKLACGCI